MTAPVHSLDARYYTDPEIYRIETMHLLASTWQFAGHISQVDDVGDYFTFSVAGENLFCVRGRDGEIRAFYNVCQHRAHELVTGSGNAKSLVCPYHAWTYELSGPLRSGPNIQSVSGFRKEEICLTSVRLENFYGFLFVNLDPDAKPMDDFYPDVRQELLEYVPHIDRLKPIRWVKIAECCNWKVAIENYSECYHCARNHPSFTAGVIKPDTYNIEAQGFCLRHTTVSVDAAKMDYEIDAAANPRATDYSTWFLFPMFSFQVYPGNLLNTYHWRATDHEHVTVWRGWYSIDGKPSDTIMALAERDRQTTVEEDIGLVEAVQRGLQSRGYRPGPLVIDPEHGVNSEHALAEVQRWVKEAIDAHL